VTQNVYETARAWLAADDCPIIVISTHDGITSVTGFRFMVHESALTEGIDRQELIARVIECHQRADIMG